MGNAVWKKLKQPENKQYCQDKDDNKG